MWGRTKRMTDEELEGLLKEKMKESKAGGLILLPKGISFKRACRVFDRIRVPSSHSSSLE